MIATLISSVVGISMALDHHGVWALVGMALSEAVVATALAWALALHAGVWRPRLGIERTHARSLAGFGGLVTGARVAGYGQSNFDNFVVGRVLGATPLGYYSVAYRMALLPIVKVSEVIGATAFAAFAGVQDDLVRLRRGVRQANCYVAIVCLPLTVGLSVSAAVLVPVALGDRWRPAVHVVELLALGGPAFTLVRLENSLYKALGRPSISLAMSAMQLTLTVPAYLIGSHWGIDGVAIAVVASTYATLPIAAVVRGKLLRQRMRDAITPLAPILLATGAMAGLTLVVRVALVDRTSAVVTLLAMVASGAAVYGAVLLLLARGLVLEALTDLRRSR
jgi:O-antigen/teichoic acid export membrane protein